MSDWIIFLSIVGLIIVIYNQQNHKKKEENYASKSPPQADASVFPRVFISSYSIRETTVVFRGSLANWSAAYRRLRRAVCALPPPPPGVVVYARESVGGVCRHRRLWCRGRTKETFTSFFVYRAALSRRPEGGWLPALHKLADDDDWRGPETSCLYSTRVLMYRDALYADGIYFFPFYFYTL